MKWIKTHTFNPDQISEVCKIFTAQINSGYQPLELMRCVFLTQDNLIHCLTVFDFIDLKDKSDIVKLNIYLLEVSKNANE